MNLHKICTSMNSRINRDGQITSSTSNSGLLNDWHKLTNEDWLQIFNDAALIHSARDIPVRMGASLQAQLETLIEYIDRYGEYHENILNPTPRAFNGLVKSGVIPPTVDNRKIRSILWNTMMRLREEIYNPSMGINLPNADSSRGKLVLDTKLELFEF